MSASSPLSAQNTTIVYDGFEESQLVVGGEEGWRKEVCCSNSLQLVSEFVRAGKQSLQSTLKKSDPAVNGGSRAEIGTRTLPQNSEQWYGFSVYLPEDTKSDRAIDILAQWQAYPDLGEGWRSPPLLLSLGEGKLFIHRRWDSRRITNDNNPEGSESIDLGAYQTSRWIDFVFHVKWSHKSDGVVEVWKDGKQVVKKFGPNSYDNDSDPYWKIGIYKPDWLKYPKKSSTTERIVYFDEVRIGDASASFKDVSPREIDNRASVEQSISVHELQANENSEEEKEASTKTERLQENLKEPQPEEQP